MHGCMCDQTVQTPHDNGMHVHGVIRTDHECDVSSLYIVTHGGAIACLIPLPLCVLMSATYVASGHMH